MNSQVALRQSEERLRTFVAASSNMVYRMNADWTRMENLVGKELLADTSKPSTSWIDKYVLPEDQPHVQSMIQHVIMNKSVFELEHRIIQADGSVGWAHSRVIPLFDGNGEITEWFGAGADITERKQAEETLHLSEQKCSIALQAAHMAAWDWNIESDITEWNDQHYYLLGLQPGNMIKTSAFFLKFIHPDDVQKVSDELMQAVTESGFYHAEFRVIRKDSQVRWMNGYGRVVSKRAGKANRMAGVMFDITHSKLLEQQKEGFISIASHELKTPVTSIKAFGEILQESLDEAGDPANTELMKKINVQIDRLTDLINALLDTTKISEAQLSLNKETFNLNDLIQERLEDLQRIIPNHSIVWDGCQDILIQADRERIGQVFTNLVSNAIKYSPKGGEVYIGCKSQQDSILVSVRDQGIGIPKEIQKNVFERFFRVFDARVRNYPGMGLGLYITAGIIHRHGGKIWVESEPEEGSTFYFTLPV